MTQQPISSSRPTADMSQIIRQQSQIEFITVNRYQVQQNAVFIDYEPQQLRKSIQEYHSLKFYHRLSLAKNIQTIEESCLERAVLHVLMVEIAKDHQDIQKELIDFYRTQFVTHNRPKPQDYRQYILTPLMTLIQGVHLQIKQQANSILTSLKGWISTQQKKQLIKTAIEMGHNNDEENKIVSIQLIVHLTPDLSKDQNEKFFLEEYTKLYNESSVRVKKEIITELKVLGENVSPEFFDKQMVEGFYLQKCLQKVWGVRKACVQMISQLVKLTSTKKQALANALLCFTKDGNKIVKVSAFKSIPQFLANYQSASMPEKLMQIYLRLMDHEINALVSRQNQILNKVSFYFPGVLLRAGVKSWQDMRKLFSRLINHRNQQVKKPIASSLHQISAIIGPELAKEHMFTALDTILKDKSDSLKLDAIDHLSEFVRLFDTVTRENLIDVFLVLQKDPKKWRVRYSIAHQLKELAMIYDTQTVFKYIFPISLKLCNDNVSEVRIEAARQIYFVIESLTDIQIYKQMAIQSIKGFGLSEKFVQRQTFAAMIQNLFRIDKFEEKFIDVLDKIVVDPVVVVRIALAISINKALTSDAKSQKKFGVVLDKMRKDSEVQEYLISDEEGIVP